MERGWRLAVVARPRLEALFFTEYLVADLVLVQSAAKLAAGSIDRPPLGLAHRHADTPVAQDR